MNIQIITVNFEKREEEEVGYVVHFTNYPEGSELEYSLPVILGSHVDTFLRVSRGELIKLMIVDGRVIALADKNENMELVKDIVKEDFSGREVNGNLKYIEDTYGINVDILEAMLLEELRDSYLKVKKFKVDAKSFLNKKGLALHMSDDSHCTLIICPKDSIPGKYMLKLAGVENGDCEEALKRLMGREFYVVDFALEILAVADKETKEVCVLRVSYDMDGNLENVDNFKKVEARGINAESIGTRVKRLVNREERSE